MRLALTLAVVVTFCGCAASNTIVRSQATSFDDTIEDTTDKLLVLNILRAKDKAPLHFDEIPSIHESIQETLSVQATYPFGPTNKSVARNTFTPTIGVQMSPSFEIDHLDTKDFVTGMASPLDPKFVKYWLDRGLDRRIVLLLFFSGADIIDTNDAGVAQAIRIKNSPRDAIESLKQLSALGGNDVPATARCDAQSEFQHYLKFIDTLTTFSAHTYTERRLVSDSLDSLVDPKAMGSIGALDPSKYQWFKNKNDKYSLYVISATPKTALCFSNSPIDSGSGVRSQPAACVQSVVDSSDIISAADSTDKLPMPSPPPGRREKPSAYCGQFNGFLAGLRAERESDAPKPNKTELRLQIRSVGEIIQFLGDLLEYQEELATFNRDNPTTLRLNTPLTLGYCADQTTSLRPGCADVFFDLRHDSCNARFTLTYRHHRFSVANYNPQDETAVESEACPSPAPESPDGSEPRDHTLEVLAVVHQLIDLQKSATDIRETPYVQLLP